MTKEEFKGFSSAAQHDMVLEALVRVTKNLETMEKESERPFVGTVKQRRNDIKLLTILAEAFGKNELMWAQKPRVTVDAGKYMPDVIDGLRKIVDDEHKILSAQQKAGKFMSCENTDVEKSLYPVKNIKASINNSGVPKGIVGGLRKISDAGMAKRRSK